MKNSTNAEKKTGIGALDVVIILALCACVIGAGLAFVFSRATAETVVKEQDFEEYVISFEAYGIRQSTAQMINSGEMYYYDSDDFGVLNDNITLTPAVVYVENDDGVCVKSYAPENGDYTKVDISGSFTVKGIRNSKGFFLLNGETKLVPNKSFIVQNDTVSFGISVTDIEKVSG